MSATDEAALLLLLEAGMDDLEEELKAAEHVGATSLVFVEELSVNISNFIHLADTTSADETMSFLFHIQEMADLLLQIFRTPDLTEPRPGEVIVGIGSSEDDTDN